MGNLKWLAQWNDHWQAFFFIGGHREGNETFRDCVSREISEELGLTEAECPVAVTVTHHLEYRAISRSAGELTQYMMELFDAQPSKTGLEKITHDPMNKWLSEDEIQRLEAHDGRAVSVSIGMLLELSGVL